MSRSPFATSRLVASESLALCTEPVSSAPAADGGRGPSAAGLCR